MINVICVRWGDKYGPEYEERLHHMVAKNLTVPFQFHCYRGQDDGLEDWWPKLRLFEKDRFKGKCLYFDLDMIIQKNIDHLLDYDGFHVIKCYWKEQLSTKYQDGMLQKEAYNMDINSSCMVWEGNDNSHIWEYFWSDPEYYMNKYSGIDRFMYHEGFIQNVFPRGIFYSRMHGEKEGDDDGWYHLENLDVCMFNGVHKMTDEHFNQFKPYEGFDKYYER